MFQVMAPSSPARITFGSTIDGRTNPVNTAFATAVPMTKAATKLKNAAHMTACSGRSTRVPTTVAIEFAESWKPLLKSNRNATRMIAMM